MDQHVIHVHQEHIQLLIQPHAALVLQALIPLSEHPHALLAQLDNTLALVPLPVLLAQSVLIQHLREDHPVQLV